MRERRVGEGMALGHRSGVGERERHGGSELAQRGARRSGAGLRAARGSAVPRTRSGAGEGDGEGGIHQSTEGRGGGMRRCNCRPNTARY